MLRRINIIDILLLTRFYRENPSVLVKLVSFTGSLPVVLMMIVIVMLTPVAQMRQASLLMLFSLILSTIVVFILKFTIRRKRYEYESQTQKHIDPWSFPSGHISRLAACIWPLIPVWYLALFITLAALFCAMARMIRGVHYFSDCLAGFVIGLLSGLGIWLVSPYFIPWIMEMIPWFSVG